MLPFGPRPYSAANAHFVAEVLGPLFIVIALDATFAIDPIDQVNENRTMVFYQRNGGSAYFVWFGGIVAPILYASGNSIGIVGNSLLRKSRNHFIASTEVISIHNR